MGWITIDSFTLELLPDLFLGHMLPGDYWARKILLRFGLWAFLYRADPGIQAS